MGASVMGSRVFTATSSQGLLYMCEMLHYVSGSRYPIVLMNANRGTATPWTIFGDHRDVMAMRDAGWIQFFVESGQEALDTVIQAYRIAEDPSVMIPVMVNLDGFTITHTYDLVSVPSQAQADKYLPPYRTANKMSLEKTLSFSSAYGPDLHLESRMQQQETFKQAAKMIAQADEEYGKIFGRSYHGMVETYACEDAEYILAVLGGVAGATRIVVDALRAEGRKVGMIKVRCLRPFPKEFFSKLGGACKVLGVVDRNISFGYEGAVYTEIRAAVRGNIQTMNFIFGLGGRDMPKEQIRSMYEKMMNLASGKVEDELQYVGARW
jgi:pyruvate ferredoxin oxidoreductase alpha subunit